MKVTKDVGFKISDHIWKPGFQWQRSGGEGRMCERRGQLDVKLKGNEIVQYLSL